MVDIEKWEADLRALEDGDLSGLANMIFAEKERRKALPFLEDQAQRTEIERAKERAALVESLVEVLPEPEPVEGARPWKAWDPTDRTTWFFYGDEAEHNDELWTNMHDPSGKSPNVWEPGAPGVDWRIWKLSGEEDGGAGSIGEVRQWLPGSSYKVHDLVKYQGAMYRVLQYHTAQGDWLPDQVPALYSLEQASQPEPPVEEAPEEEPPVEESTDPEPPVDPPVDPEPKEPETPAGPPVWEVGKAYVAGDLITYQNKTYKVLQPHTSAAHWPPNAVASLYSPQS